MSNAQKICPILGFNTVFVPEVDNKTGLVSVGKDNTVQMRPTHDFSQCMKDKCLAYTEKELKLETKTGVETKKRKFCISLNTYLD